jgi:hypothetical protein
MNAPSSPITTGSVGIWTGSDKMSKIGKAAFPNLETRPNYEQKGSKSLWNAGVISWFIKWWKNVTGKPKTSLAQ